MARFYIVAAVALLSVLLPVSFASGGGEEPAPDNVLALTPATFDSTVGKSAPAFVEFYAPWCGHCKNLAPEYAVVAETFKGSEASIVVAKVDADAHKDLAGRFDVKGFPTLKYFPAGSTTPEDYEGGRTAADIIAFINGKTGLSKKPKVVPSAVQALTPATFDSVVAQPNAFKFLEFYAPWCGHCKALAPTYEKLAAAFEGEASVVIAKIDADAHRDLGERYGVTGFPTIKYLPKGAAAADAVTYEGGRDLASLVDFVNAQAGTSRAADGSLLPSAGRSGLLDALAVAFMAPSADRKGIQGQVAAVAQGAVNSAGGAATEDAAKAPLYAAVMEKIAAKGDEYVAKESARLAGMLASESIAKAKKGDLALKRNVLLAFAPQPAADASADAEL